MFSKEEIKARLSQLRDDASEKGQPAIDAELSLAMVIASTALFGKKLRSGEDYIAHPLAVAANHTRSKTQRIINILHDVVEDSRWTLADIKEIGFSAAVVTGLDGMTKRPNEKYFDFIVRCGLSGRDAIDGKINDIHHNSDPTRYRHIGDSEKYLLKQDAYNIAYHYLIDLKKTKEDRSTHYNTPGTAMFDYMKSRVEFSSDPVAANRLLNEFSSDTRRFSVPALPFPAQGPGSAPS